MVYKVRQILRDARIAMDENKVGEQLIHDGDIDTLSLDELIASKIEDGARIALSEAPLHLLDGFDHIDGTVYWGKDGAGWILLPEDFMRLIAFKMSDWERTVHSAISELDPQYQVQSSRQPGLRGNPQKPVAAIVTRSDGRALEFYSCRSESARVEQALYLAEPRIDGDGGIKIPERCYRGAVSLIASLVLATIGRAEQSEYMTEICKQLMK